MDGDEIRYYEFGDFRLDARRGKLTRRGEFVPVTKRHFVLLLFLVENSGQVLEHDEILETVWDGLFVEQSNLKKGISALRQILQESPDDNGFIKTVPRRGYKFDAPVRALAAVDSNDVPEKMIFVHRTNTEIFIEEEIEEDEADILPAAYETKALPAAAVLETESLFAKISRHKIAVAAAAIAALLFMVAAAFGLKSYFAARPIRFSAESVEITKATSEGDLYGTYVSPDGNYIVYVFAERDGKGLRVRHLATGSVTQLIKLPNAGFWCVNFSSDGNFVYYGVENFDDHSASGLYRIPFLGGEPRRLFKDIPTDLSLAPDGSRIAFNRKLENLDVEIVIAGTEGGDQRQHIATFSPEMHVDGLNWSPDGSGLLVTVRKQLSVNKVVSYVSEFSAGDGREKIVVPEQENKITSAIWLPDRKSLLASVRDANAESYKIRQFFPADGEWRRVVNDNNTYRILSLTRDGKTLVSTREMRVASVWLAENGQTTDFRQITEGAGGYDRLAWTRDGRIIYDSPETADATFWVMNADGTHKKQLSDGKDGITLFPQISGDGTSVIFNSNRSGTRQIWRIGLDGENLKQLVNIPTGAHDGALLSDGTTVIYSSYIKPNGWTIFKQTADGKTLQLSKENSDIYSISPDERLIAYSAQNETTKKYQVFVRALDGGELVKTFDFEPHRALRWTRDGKALTYDAQREDAEQIVMQPLDGGPPQTLVSFRSEEIFWFDWSFDGKKLAIVRGRQLADAVIIKSAEN